MYNSMIATYRVVCSYSPKNPDKIYVDICRDGFCSHDMLFLMQKKRYKDDNLEQVINDSRGIMIRASREGDIRLVYTGHRDKYAKEKQKKLREKIDPLILKTFKEMREKGSIQTISESLFVYDKALGESCRHKNKVDSLQEERALATLAKEKRIEELKEHRQAYYEHRKYAYAPHLRLMLMQAERSGD